MRHHTPRREPSTEATANMHDRTHHANNQALNTMPIIIITISTTLTTMGTPRCQMDRGREGRIILTSRASPLSEPSKRWREWVKNRIYKGDTSNKDVRPRASPASSGGLEHDFNQETYGGSYTYCTFTRYINLRCTGIIFLLNLVTRTQTRKLWGLHIGHKCVDPVFASEPGRTRTYWAPSGGFRIGRGHMNRDRYLVSPDRWWR